LKHLRLITAFMQASFQEEAAYRANFFISLLTSLFNLVTGISGVVVIFSQVDSIQGWDLPSTMSLLGVYLIVSAIRGLFIGPSLESLSGMDGEIWTGAFDFTLLQPVNTQFLVSLRRWRWFASIDLLLGMGVLVVGVIRLGVSLSFGQLLSFLLTLLAGMLVLYAILLVFAALIFWSPGVLSTWVFDGIFQLGRYPMGMYPGWVKIILTWIIPVGVITTIPAQSLTGTLSNTGLFTSLGVSVLLIVLSSALFRVGLKRYTSASS
jgi:ABC-2 type transport system permease protein